MTDAEELLERVDGIVHEDTQLHEAGLDLTVAEVYDIDRPGEIDFGGDELEAAVSSPHETNLRDPDDDYAWWELGAERTCWSTTRGSRARNHWSVSPGPSYSNAAGHTRRSSSGN